MNKRTALRLAAGELATVAWDLCESHRDNLGTGAVIPDEWSDRDVGRVADAFEEMAERLDALSTGVRRKKRSSQRVDPNQAALFE